MRNLLLTLAFRGTAYHGFQVQANARTVCEVFQDAVQRVISRRCDVKGASRTDAGVHALRYCANFRSDCTIPIGKVPLALNARLPGDIAVTDACEVDTSFNAIGSCIQKEYIYKILNSRIPDPFLDKRVCFYPSRLDIDEMRAAAKAFEGTHDFAAGATPNARAILSPCVYAPTGFCTTWFAPWWERWSTQATESSGQRISPRFWKRATAVSPARQCRRRAFTCTAYGTTAPPGK